jgi:predicted CopG family antitoxin
MKMKPKQLTMMKVHRKTLDSLKKIKIAERESYEDVILRLLKEREIGANNGNEQREVSI